MRRQLLRQLPRCLAILIRAVVEAVVEAGAAMAQHPLPHLHGTVEAEVMATSPGHGVQMPSDKARVRAEAVEGPVDRVPEVVEAEGRAAGAGNVPRQGHQLAQAQCRV